MTGFPYNFPITLDESWLSVQSKCIYYDYNYVTQIKIEVYYTGNPQFFVGLADKIGGTIVWEEVTLVGSGKTVIHNFTHSGKALYWKTILSSGESLQAQKNAAGRLTAPAVRIYDITTSVD